MMGLSMPPLQSQGAEANLESPQLQLPHPLIRDQLFVSLIPSF
jgi:hypothetical protein